MFHLTPKIFHQKTMSNFCNCSFHFFRYFLVNQPTMDLFARSEKVFTFTELQNLNNGSILDNNSKSSGITLLIEYLANSLIISTFSFVIFNSPNAIKAY